MQKSIFQFSTLSLSIKVGANWCNTVVYFSRSLFIFKISIQRFIFKLIRLHMFFVYSSIDLWYLKCFVLGYRGYGCTDSSQAHLSRYLPSVLFLTLSNLMFIPAIIVAIYYRLYIEALVYFFNMFFSTVSFCILEMFFF
jgi:hypothetical protein